MPGVNLTKWREAIFASEEYVKMLQGISLQMHALMQAKNDIKRCQKIAAGLWGLSQCVLQSYCMIPINFLHALLRTVS